MVIPLAKPAQRWLYDVASSGYFAGLAMVTMAILGAGYVAASLGIGRHESHAGWMPFDCGHLLVFVKTVSSVGGGGGVVSGPSYHNTSPPAPHHTLVIPTCNYIVDLPMHCMPQHKNAHKNDYKES